MDKSEIVRFYNGYIDRQARIGVNRRHETIFKYLLDFGLKKDSKVLEIGCGIGTLSGLIINYLSEEGQFVGIDISDKSIEIAKNTYSKFKNVEFKTFDVTENNLATYFDIVILPDVLEHIPLELHDKLFYNLSKIILPQGVLLINIPHARFQEWLKKYEKEKMQIVDQVVEYDFIVKNLSEHNFEILFSKVYSLWRKPFDYQVVVAVVKGDVAFEEISEKGE